MALPTTWAERLSGSMPVLTPDLIWLTAEEIRQCICEALEAESECGCPCRSCTVVGPPVWDTCCPDGQLTVSLERFFLHDNFPSAATGPVFCAAPFAGDFVIQLLRCVPVVRDDGTPPSCEELSESARRIYQDLYISMRAIVCCLSVAKRQRKFVMRDARPIGPDGGCAGFEIRLTVELHDPLPV